MANGTTRSGRANNVYFISSQALTANEKTWEFLTHANPLILAALAGLWVLALTADSLSIRMFARATGERLKIWLSYQLTAMRVFFNLVTPFSAGGHPFMIYALSREGIQGGKATAIVIGQADQPFPLHEPRRPLAFLLILVLRLLPITPNMITGLSMVAGLLSGFYFTRGDYGSLLFAALFLLLANVLDAADGQLARLRGTCSRLGKTLDGLADVVTYVSIIGGVAYAMARSMAAQGWVWMIYGACTFASGLIHITLFDHFKNELIFYSFPEYPEKLESVKSLRAQRSALANRPGSGLQRLLLSVYIFFYSIEEAVIQIAHPRGYPGYLEWYEGNPNVPESAKETMRAGYKRWNQKLVLFWGMLSAAPHPAVFIIAALANRIDLIFWILCVPFNFYMILMIVFQRLSLKAQLQEVCKTRSLEIVDQLGPG